MAEEVPPSSNSAPPGFEVAATSAATSGATTAVAPETSAAASGDTFSPNAAPGEALDLTAIDDLLKSASFDDPSTAADVARDAADFKLPDLEQVMQDAQVSSIDLLRDVDLNVKIELGRSRMLVEDVLKLSEGSVVELDKLAGDPVDVFVNERLVARGEVLVLNDNFCVRINEIVAGVREEGL